MRLVPKNRTATMLMCGFAERVASLSVVGWPFKRVREQVAAALDAVFAYRMNLFSTL